MSRIQAAAAQTLFLSVNLTYELILEIHEQFHIYCVSYHQLWPSKITRVTLLFEELKEAFLSIPFQIRKRNKHFKTDLDAFGPFRRMGPLLFLNGLESDFQPSIQRLGIVLRLLWEEGELVQLLTHRLLYEKQFLDLSETFTKYAVHWLAKSYARGDGYNAQADIAAEPVLSSVSSKRSKFSAPGTLI